MTRKEMIAEIAKQARCSKRLVRKKLFNRYLEIKKRYNIPEFTNAFLDKNTNWLDKNELVRKWKDGDKNANPWRTPNAFDVFGVQSGLIVVFTVKYVDNDGYRDISEVGTKLYNW